MYTLLEPFFWLVVSSIFYVYVGYPFLLIVLTSILRTKPVYKADITPSVSLIVSAYNEAGVIVEKIENSLRLDYPRSSLEIIVVSDGSTDKTDEIVSTYREEGVTLVRVDNNQGKSAAENAGVAVASGDIIVFSDANAMLRPSALRRLIRNFADGRVGCVVGRVTYINETDTSVSREEGIYWRYELFLRQEESRLGNFTMGSGPIMAIRRELFNPLDANVGEDFVLPMQVAMHGKRVVYEPEAVSEEILFQNTARSMLRSKIRIITKDLRGLFICKPILNPFHHPLCMWGLISHKLLRWFVPYFLLVVFVFTILLLKDDWSYYIALNMQLVFYALAAIGYASQKRGTPWRIFGIPFSFCLVNAAALIGIAQFVAGKKMGRWAPRRFEKVMVRKVS